MNQYIDAKALASICSLFVSHEKGIASDDILPGLSIPR